jgi:endonuclease/exonuclease/phosphatase family metal-dependent hydrolase
MLPEVKDPRIDLPSTRGPAERLRWNGLVTRSALLLSGLLSLASCGIRRAPPGAGPPPCLETGPTVPSAEWHLRPEVTERAALDAWCWGVGPPSVVNGHGAEVVADSVLVLAWNAHVGNGDLPRLLGDLRAGVLTGRPVEHFVILLQEVHRGGPEVPASVPGWAAAAARIGVPESDRIDIVRLAEEEGLSLLYAPSMRNGVADDGGEPEDRGNAILSTLPLTDPLFVELPFERQRRVAVVASIGGSTRHGAPWALRIASIHLDNRARLGRIHRSLGAAQLHQAEFLARTLAEAGPAILGGDFNSWEAGHRAASVRRLRDEFPLPRVRPSEPTAVLPSPLPELALDHLMFRLPDAWDVGYEVVPDTYESDHRPLLGWVRFRSTGGGAVAAAPDPESASGR